MGELSIVKKGASGPKVQVLTGSASGMSLITTGVKINPTRVYAFISSSKSTGTIDSYVKSGALNYYTVHYNSYSAAATVTLDGETLTISNSDYNFSGSYQVTLIED